MDNLHCEKTMSDWFGRERSSRKREILPQAVVHEPLHYGLLQLLPSPPHASYGISQQQTFRNHKSRAMLNLLHRSSIIMYIWKLNCMVAEVEPMQVIGDHKNEIIQITGSAMWLYRSTESSTIDDNWEKTSLRTQKNTNKTTDQPVLQFS